MTKGKDQEWKDFDFEPLWAFLAWKYNEPQLQAAPGVQSLKT